MKLAQYLKRIELSGPCRPDLSTLRRVHHQHLLNIPYENLDVQLSAPLDFDETRIFEKLIVRRRGGWCYEMNGLLAWALREIGFDVTRMSGAVMRETMGDDQFGNHLVLEVMLDRAYLADVGLGDGVREPIPIEPGVHRQNGMSYRLEHLQDGTWRFHNHKLSNVKSFDFRHELANEAELAAKCAWLQESPDSPFNMALIAQRFDAQGIHVLLGKMASYLSKAGKTTNELTTFEEFSEHLRRTFGLDVELDTLWSKVDAAHEKLFNRS